VVVAIVVVAVVVVGAKAMTVASETVGKEMEEGPESKVVVVETHAEWA
jgi:hypothetical protein